MANRTVTVNYKAFYNDLPFPTSASFKIGLDRPDYDENGSYPQIEQTFEINESGTTDSPISLWCNSEGFENSRYVVTEPDGQQWTCRLEYGDGSPISLTQLRAENAT